MLPILFALVGVGASAAAYAILIEPNWFAVRRHRVPCLPPGAPPLRALHLSDLHLRSVQGRKRRFLRGLAGYHPDLILATGDFLGDETSVPAAVESVTAIRARIASMFVLGSNDYYAPTPRNPFRYLRPRRARPPTGRENPWRDLVAGLEQRGWRFLSNRSGTVADIEVVGLDDAHIGRADLSVASPRQGRGFRLAIAHSPDVAPDLAGMGYDLIVCGHTHGGQVRVPGIGALVTNSDLPRRMARGVHRVGASWLHVCAGLGTSMYAPFRFACRPEVCLLELVARQEV